MSLEAGSPDEPGATATPVPLVSVAMPAHRDSAYFRAALASVLAQTLGDLEVIVGDDSGGELRAAVDEASDPRIRYVPRGEQLGFVGNHIATLDLARGRYLAILHDDDLWQPDYLERTVGVLEADPEVGLVCTDLWEVFEDGTRRRPGDWITEGRRDDWLELAFTHNYFVPTTTVFRAEVWAGRRTKRWPEATVGDVVFWYDAALDGTPLYWVDAPLADYRRHAGQISQDLATRSGQVLVNSLYAFPDRPEIDALRRRRVALGLVGRAGALLRAGDALQARADLARAHRESPETLTRKRRLLAVLTWIPGIGRIARLRSARRR
ncbi:MAG: glycosyltransferase [Solirubrobacteraceae bacterium]|nr:glycosyltransferase [Solirubrobacteraceae bacterium]